MKIISYNVNGIRSALGKGLISWLDEQQADLVCLQEIKALEADIPEQEFRSLGYRPYWFPAKKKGYSGVGILSRHEPEEVTYGCGLPQADEEGRVLELKFRDFRLINTYFPSGSSGEERQAYKMEFLSDYLTWLKQRFEPTKDRFIIAGDYNICHREIDIHDPKGNKNSSGFLPEERAWMDQFFEMGMVDSFRMLNPEPHHYSWWSFRANARNNNKGWRIDYINVSEALRSSITSATLFPQAKHSDHCPVVLEWQ